MIRVLHVMSGIGYQGGVQALIWNYYKHIDEDEVRFDFIVHSNRMEGYEQRFIDKKSKIFYVPPKKEGLIQNYREICRILKRNNYDIMHVHQDFLGYIALLAAKNNNIKVRIMHSHKANMLESPIKRVMRWCFTSVSIKLATDLFACGKEAAIWTYGYQRFKSGQIYILNNAIETKDYLFDQNIRETIRTKYGFTNKIIIGNVARFTYQKNQELLIDILEYLLKLNPNYLLVLVGDGELLMSVKEKVSCKGLEQSVIFLGAKDNVNELLQGMDVFVLTSRFEGLPVTMVEAQTADLPCVISNNITHEIDINKKTQYVKLDDCLEAWCNAIIDNSNFFNRSNMQKEVDESGFNIVKESEKLTDYYKKRVLNNYE